MCCAGTGRYLYERHVVWETLFEALQRLAGGPEGREVRDHRPQAAVRHEAGQHLGRGAAEQVELDVQGFAFL